jgi:hypothetical protein
MEHFLFRFVGFDYPLPLPPLFLAKELKGRLSLLKECDLMQGDPQHPTSLLCTRSYVERVAVWQLFFRNTSCTQDTLRIPQREGI